MPPFILTCPSSRGIGLELTRRLLRTTTLPVIATARTDLEGLREKILGGLDEEGFRERGERLEVRRVDVTDESTISELASHITQRFGPPPKSHLRLAFLTAGILHPEKSPSQIVYSDALETYKVNVISHLLLFKHLSPFLPRKSTTLEPEQGLPNDHAIWAMMSARVGSVSDNSLGGWYSYRSSKSAVNQLAKSFDIHLKQSTGDKAIAVSLHPGTVKTGLSKEFWKGVPKGKLFSGEFAAERLHDVVRGLDTEVGRGRCWDWEGKEISP
ncbi:MAG: hypothetical protein M1827_001111 [Pycnora praestabilis]|nr:MAG: hypothetical protein M1827_001111 [Pycnora praestabilis]